MLEKALVDNLEERTEEMMMLTVTAVVVAAVAATTVVVAEKEELAWVVRHRAREILDEWPRDGYRQRVREMAREDDVRTELDASPRPGDAALRDAIDSASS